MYRALGDAAGDQLDGDVGVAVARAFVQEPLIKAVCACARVPCDVRVPMRCNCKTLGRRGSGR